MLSTPTNEMLIPSHCLALRVSLKNSEPNSMISSGMNEFRISALLAVVVCKPR